MSRSVRLNPLAIPVMFSQGEQVWLRRLAEERQAPKEGHATARDKRIVHRDNVQTHLIGLLGEYAVSKVMGVPFDRDAYVAGDLEKDIMIYGVTVEIKTLQGYLAFPVLEDFIAEVAVLVWHAPGVVDRVSIQGWIDRESFGACHFVDDFGYGRRPCMQPADLHPMQALASYCLMKRGGVIRE